MAHISNTNNDGQNDNGDKYRGGQDGSGTRSIVADGPKEIAKFTVRPEQSGKYNVCQDGFRTAISQFDDIDTAESYALRLAETHFRWVVETYDEAGILVGTYNSKDDSMPKPAADSNLP